MDAQLLLKLTDSCYNALSKGNFEESDAIFSILNYLYGDSGISEFFTIYGLLRMFEYKSREVFANRTTKSFVYFIKDVKSKSIKIGCTTNIKERIKQLNTRYETTFKLLGLLEADNMYEVEHFFHTVYKKYRVKNEIFKIPDNKLNPILSLIAEGKQFKEIQAFINNNFMISEMSA